MRRLWDWLGGLMFQGYDNAVERELVAMELHLLRTRERACVGRPPESAEKFREYAEHVVAYYEAHPVPVHVDRVARDLLEELDR